MKFFNCRQENEAILLLILVVTTDPAAHGAPVPADRDGHRVYQAAFVFLVNCFINNPCNYIEPRGKLLAHAVEVRAVRQVAEGMGILGSQLREQQVLGVYAKGLCRQTKRNYLTIR